MALTYPGGYITKSPPAPTSTSAPGIWTMDQALQYIKAGTWPTPPVGDPYWQYTTLLSGTGSTNGAQNNTFLDSSSNNFTITRNGNTTQGTFTPFSAPNGYWGNYFDGTGDYFTVPNSSNFAFGTGDFTVECWVYWSYIANSAIISTSTTSQNAGSWILGYSNNANSLGFCYDVPGFNFLEADFSPYHGNWTHVAVSRSGTTLRLFFNGTQVASTTNSTNFSYSSNNVKIGQRWSNQDAYTASGYLSNLRVVKGTAVYTANFTPPTSPLSNISGTALLFATANRFIDTSSNALTVTVGGNPSVVPFAPFGNTSMYSTTSVGGSGYLDGTGDYLTISGLTFNPRTTTFTVEGWFYRITGTTYMLFGSVSSTAFYVSVSSNNFYVGDGSINTISGAGTAGPLNAWEYIAMSFDGTTYRLYQNGVLIGSSTTLLASNTVSLGIGAYNNGSALFNGYISGARYSNTARYTGSTMTIPTAPFTNDGNTSLLANFTNAGIYDQAAKNDMETAGNAQVSTSVVKYGNSMYFDGTGDYLPIPVGQTFNFGTGQFTIECWAYFNSVATGVTVVGAADTGGNIADGVSIYCSASGTLRVYGPSVSNSATATVATGQWYHIAVTRINNTFSLFLNGNLQGTFSDTGSIVGTNSSKPFYIGSLGAYTSYVMNGYLSDFRVTRGLARYTYSFTLPTRSLPNFYAAPVTPTADPYFDYTTLLLPGSGTNGAQNNTFLDSSTNAYSITRNGNTTQGTFSPFSQTGWSNYFDGTGDYLATSQSQTVPATGDFTIDGWFYLGTSSYANYPTIFSQGTAGNAGRLNVYVNNDGKLGFAIGTTVATAGSAVAPFQWNYFAITRTGSSVTFYLNGVSIGTATNSVTVQNTTPLIGSDWNGDPYRWVGYLSNIRVSNTVRTISLPTAPFTQDANTILLSCQSNRFVDTSTTAATITAYGNVSVQAFSPFAPTAAYSAATNGGSGYFDGTGDYLTTANSSSFAFGTGDFTIEGWFYLSGNTHGLADVSGGSTGYWLWNIASGTMYWQNNRSVSNLISASLSNYQNQWVHFAVVRNSGTTRIYQNGVQIGSASDSANYSGTAGNLEIGYESGNPSALVGYMSGFRIVKGTAVYTGAFTPPTAPLTAIANTSILLNYTNAGITDATAKNDLETVGNAQISNTTAKFGSTSMYFDGTGDWLIGYQNALYDMGSGDFTVEFWVNTTTASSSACLVGATTGGGPSNTQWGIFQGYTSSTSIDIYLSNGSSYFANTGGGSVTDGNWHHVAFTRYGSSGKLFLDGSQVGSTLSLSTTSLAPANKPIYVGSQGGSFPFTGYIQDLRITKGIARYTQPFTPPTAAFQLL